MIGWGTFIAIIYDAVAVLGLLVGAGLSISAMRDRKTVTEVFIEAHGVDPAFYLGIMIATLASGCVLHLLVEILKELKKRNQPAALPADPQVVSGAKANQEAAVIGITILVFLVIAAICFFSLYLGPQ